MALTYSQIAGNRCRNFKVAVVSYMYINWSPSVTTFGMFPFVCSRSLTKNGAN